MKQFNEDAVDEQFNNTICSAAASVSASASASAFTLKSSKNSSTIQTVDNWSDTSEKSYCAIDMINEQSSGNSMRSLPTIIDCFGMDNATSNDLQFGTNSLEIFDSINSSRASSQNPAQLSFEFVSTEFPRTIATLFLPKKERQTFI